MDRLTMQNYDYADCEFMDSGIAPVFNRLAAYEDTGLEPEEIQDYLNATDEYVEASEEGRLIVLPCKVGDTVWYIPSGTRKIYSGICHCVSIQQGGVNIHLYDFDGDAATYPASRVFLTREEAEAALGGDTHG